MLGGLVLLLGVACVLVYIFASGALSAGTPTVQHTVVPQFVGKQFLDAQALAQTNHLQLQETKVESDQPVNVVLTQDVANGQSVVWGKTINVTVSKGLGQVVVPDVTKMLAKDACTALADPKVNLQCNVVNYLPSDSVDNGKVISTDPPAGTKVDPGSTVNLTVSTGPAATPTTPPQPTVTPQPTAVPSPSP
jgi:serine/threonine-protein kinase